MKLSKRLVVVLVLMVLAISLTGCGADKAQAPEAEARTSIVGKWNVDMKALNALLGVDAEAFDDVNYLIENLAITVEFTEDGKVITSVVSGENVTTQEDAYTATYEEGNFRLSINDGDPYYFRLDGNKLVIVSHE